MYLRVREAAKELGNVSESLVYGLCKAGRLEHIRVGVGRGTIRILLSSVERFKEEGRSPVVAVHPPLKHLKVD